MARVIAYYRPAEMEEALALLARPEPLTALLAGGTVLNAGGSDPVEVVDLQSLGLAGLTVDDERIRLGSMTRLHDVADDPLVPSEIRNLARRELPSTLRTLATVGGTIAAGGWESELLAGFLAFDGLVSLRSASGQFDVPLPQLLADRSTLLTGRMITELSLAIDGSSTTQRTGRTPGDVPIVAVVGRRAASGRLRLAVTGVAATPVLVDDSAVLQPPSDFRGSSEYRSSLASSLIARVRAELES
jgi:aerobic carbon-monoxide dehydrogenase medium subunit